MEISQQIESARKSTADVKRLRRWLLLFALCSAQAMAFEGRVVAVSDGDTLTVSAGGTRQKIRLADIDAPELAQFFGRESALSLSALCADQQVEVTPVTLDRYGRTVARVACRETDAGLHQLRNGMAWVFDRYVQPDSPLYLIQIEAIEGRRGLWAYPFPVKPWVWRASQK